jgi:hypothetical protein
LLISFATAVFVFDEGGATGLLFAAVAANPDVDRTNELIERVLRTETDETIVSRARRARNVLEHRAHRAS